MKTIIIKDLEQFDQATRIIREGGLVAAPTETVYGLCANALNETAVGNIFKAKGRPNDNPLIVHIADLDMLYKLVTEVSPIAQKLIERFWPGPLTLIFKAKSIVPRAVTAGLDTVAVRFPSHPLMQKLIKDSGLPIAAPSANTSGKPSPTNMQRVFEDMDGKIDCIIDGDSSEIGVESTIVDTTGDIATVLRPGGITYEMLEEVLGKIAIDPAITNTLKEGQKPKAPGMKYTHYSPNADVFIIKNSSAYFDVAHHNMFGDLDNLREHLTTLVNEAHEHNKKVGILATDETKHLFDADLVLSAGTESDLQTISAHLFEVLRSFDDNGIDIVYSLAFPKKGLGVAIMNRLEKSAGYHFITI
ncbi:L-threonylcarbamoyladenylate synthase [Cellulosilyticum ruminicola]|uniref:L-threonylcarbamoyladenylate synthase n=1 Tax=Cellulosilyticum ruminicola TaxID=425254 RepID=UPI0006D19E9C|nr:L-threonylcarbamoyladenylate synthase [Cellulosilyticum ruminicola]